MFYYNQNSAKLPAKVDYGYIPLILEGIGALGVIYELIMSDYEEFDIFEVKNHLIGDNFEERAMLTSSEDEYHRVQAFTSMEDFLGGESKRFSSENLDVEVEIPKNSSIFTSRSKGGGTFLGNMMANIRKYTIGDKNKEIILNIKAPVSEEEKIRVSSLNTLKSLEEEEEEEEDS
jgi:hypothetical protein